MMNQEPDLRQDGLLNEQAVIGAILVDDRCLPEVERVLSPEDFRLEPDRALYEAAPWSGRGRKSTR